MKNQRETIKWLAKEAGFILEKEIKEPEAGIVLPPIAAGERYLKWKAKMRLFVNSLPNGHPFKWEMTEKIDDPEVSAIKEMKSMIEVIMEHNNIQ